MNGFSKLSNQTSSQNINNQSLLPIPKSSRVSLGTGANRLSLAPAKLPRGLAMPNNGSIIGDSSSQGDSKYLGGRTSLGTSNNGNRASSTSGNRQSILIATGRPSLAPRQSVGYESRLKNDMFYLLISYLLSLESQQRSFLLEILHHCLQI